MQTKTSRQPWLLNLSLIWLLCAPVVSAEPIRVVLEVSPPHQTYDNGQVAGLSTAVVELMLAQAGLQPRYEVYPWARAFRLAASHPNILIYNMARTPEREGQFEWIGKVASYQFGLLKLTSRRDIKVQQLSDIHQYVVGAQRDDFAADWLKYVAKQPVHRLQLQPDVVETWRLFAKGKLDLMIDDPNAIQTMLDQHQLASADVQFVLFVPELRLDSWIAIKKGSDPALVLRLRQAYAEIEGSPQLQKVLRPELTGTLTDPAFAQAH